MNRDLHAGACALFCVGVILLMLGWLGLRGTPVPIHCGDDTCEEAHP